MDSVGWLWCCWCGRGVRVCGSKTAGVHHFTGQQGAASARPAAHSAVNRRGSAPAATARSTGVCGMNGIYHKLQVQRASAPQKGFAGRSSEGSSSPQSKSIKGRSSRSPGRGGGTPPSAHSPPGPQQAPPAARPAAAGRLPPLPCPPGLADALPSDAPPAGEGQGLAQASAMPSKAASTARSCPACPAWPAHCACAAARCLLWRADGAGAPL